ncbi:MAG: hypothetical protein CL916_02730 [Deltaproteobacteria bacterium]|nr:hypothetical protein [Deltaproteobacteria bacterium]
MKEEVERLHKIACVRGDAGYTDPSTGFFVLTSHYLQKRRNCCGAGCRHCPYSAEEQKAAGRPKIRREQSKN